MKIQNLILPALFATTSLFAQSGEELFNKNCAICHTTIVGVNESGGETTNVYEAPYAKDIVNKLKSETKNQDEFIAFIQSYINEPDKRKSLYGKKAIKNFGLMPSLNGVMSDEETILLANYLYNDYGKERDKIKSKSPKVAKETTKVANPNEVLFDKYCAKCHTTIVGLNESGGEVSNVYVAPYAKDVITKLKSETKSKEEFITFVKNYINEPDKRKSLYGRKAIKDFGLMPSLEGVMSESEITGLADYLYSKYDK